MKEDSPAVCRTRRWCVHVAGGRMDRSGGRLASWLDG